MTSFGNTYDRQTVLLSGTPRRMTPFAVGDQGTALLIPVGSGPTPRLSAEASAVTERAGDVTAARRELESLIVGLSQSYVTVVLWLPGWLLFFFFHPPSTTGLPAASRPRLLFLPLLPLLVATKLWSAYRDHDPFLVQSFPYLHFSEALS